MAKQKFGRNSVRLKLPVTPEDLQPLEIGTIVYLDGHGLMTGLSMLTGEDGYEGLTLMMNQYRDLDTTTFWGVIIPSDKVPPFPELPAE